MNTVLATPPGGAVGDLGTPMRHGSTLNFFFSDNYGRQSADPNSPSYYGATNDELMTSTTKLTPPHLAPALTWNQTALTVESSLGNLNMSFGQTIQSGFSTRGTGSMGSRFLSFHRGNRWAVCNDDSECGAGLVCDENLGTHATYAFFGIGSFDACYLPNPGMASGMACEGEVDGDPCPIACGVPFGQDHGWWFAGICRDPTSSMMSSSNLAHRMVESAAERIEVGELVGTHVDDAVSDTWITNKFINHTMVAVRAFDPALPAQNDFRPPNPTTAAAEQNVSVLIWGRPNYVGNSAIGARARLYFAYNKNPKHFGWAPQYYCGTAEPDGFCADQSLALPVDVTTGDFANENFFNHFGVHWSQTLNKFVMLYGGNLPQELVDLIHTNDGTGPSIASSERIYYRTASSPWGPWSSRALIYDSATDPNADQKLYDPAGPGWPAAMPAYQLTQGQATEPGHLYSFNIIDSWSDGAPAADQVLTDVFFNVSTWNPYGTQLWKARIGSGTPKTRTSAFFSNWYPHGFTMTGGTWSGGGDRISQTSNNTGVRAIFNPANHVYNTDYRFEIDVYTGDNDSIGLYARFTDTNNNYLMWTKLDEGDGRTHIIREKGGVKTEIGSFPWTYTQYAWAEWAIEVDGPVIRAYINDVQQIEILDTDPLYTGYAGLWMENFNDARFDDMRIDACK